VIFGTGDAAVIVRATGGVVNGRMLIQHGIKVTLKNFEEHVG
jgi:hypothetical protein